MKILYVSQLSKNDSAEYRRWALLREGHEVHAIDSSTYGAKHPLLRKIEFRITSGPEVSRLNHEILSAVSNLQPDVVWCDKLLWMQPSTLHALRERGVVSVSYMIDNFFGPRRDPGWRLYAKTIPLYDLHCTQRDSNLLSYREAGARDVMKVQTAFEPTIHFPATTPFADAERDRGVSFIGTPYDKRAETLTRLQSEGLPVSISGSVRHWNRALPPAGFKSLYCEGELYGQSYREAIWRSRINLSFLTHSNRDEFVHKSFEIAACGGFLLAERTAGHMERFVEDREAVFFDGYKELLEKIRHYFDDEDARRRISLAGCHRAWNSGYDNDSQVRLITNRLRSILAARQDRYA